jgi:5'-nucleotidase
MFLIALAAIPAQAQEQAFTLTVMHTNDVHATYDPDQDDLGGAARQAAVVKQIRAHTDHSLLLDAGDRFTGSIFHSYYQGWDSAQVMNQLGYDAMTLGSYEFTHGADVLARFVDLLDFPVALTNVDFSDSRELAGKVQPTVVIDFDGEQVGIIGVTQGDSRIRPIPELTFDTDYLDVAQRAADELAAQGVNKIILLSHLGYFQDLELATQLSGVDLIVGGDSNTLLSNTLPDAEGPYPAVVTSASGDPALIVQAWDHDRVMGRIDLEFDAEGTLTGWEGDAILLDAEIDSDPDMTKLIEQLREPLGDFLGDVIGESTTRLEGERDVCRFEECAMGNLIADAMRVATNADIAFQNGGGIRASIDAGQITVGDALDVLPFSNTYVIFELSGADIVAALENSVSRVESTEGTGRFLQVSGLRFSWDGSREVGRRVVSVDVLNADGEYETLDPDEVYTVATNDYLFAGGDDYAMFAEDSINGYDFGRTLDEIVRAYIQDHSPLSLPATEGRIIRVDR